jgi:cyanophycin synthetase
MEPLRILRTLMHLGPTPVFERPSVGLIFATPDPELPLPTGWRETLAGLGLDVGAPLDIRASEQTPDALLAVTQVSLWLQRLAGHQVNQAAIGRHWEEGRWEVQIVHEHMETAFWAGELATDLLARSPAAGAGASLDGEQSARRSIAEFLRFAAAWIQDPNTRLLIQAADARGIPWINLDQFPFDTEEVTRIPRHGLLQVGHGRRRQVALGSLPADLPPQTLERIQTWTATRAALTRAGLSIPGGDPENSHINRASRAVRAAERIGFPVVLRPAVRAPLETPAIISSVVGPLWSPGHVEIAYEWLAPHSRVLCVEAFVPGDRQRWIVIGDKVAAVARCAPPGITGDGRSTVAQLIEAEAARHATRPTARAWRDLAEGSGDLALHLRLQGVDRNTVPEAGKQVILGATATPHHGGSCADCTESADPALAELALAAARACDLSTVCGVDLVVTDPNGDTAVVADVIAGPDLFGHHFPEAGETRDLAGALLDHWFPEPGQARIPILAVTGTNGKTTTAAMAAEIMRRAGYRTALVTTTGAMVDGEWLLRGDVAGVTGASVALADSRTEALVIETARGGLIKIGMPFDHCDVAACLNVEYDHIGLDGISNVDDLARVKRRILERCTRAGVINADDSRCLAMRPWISGESVILVSRDAGNESVKEHRAAGGMAVILESSAEGDWIVLGRGSETTRIVATAELPFTWHGRIRFAVENAMHAAAMAIGYGIPLDAVAGGLRQFVGDPELLPCRMNLITRFPFTLLLDYAHNPHGFRALTEAALTLPTAGRRILAFSIPDDRDDHSIRDAALAVAGHYDHYFCKGLFRPRHPDPYWAPRLLAETLQSCGVSPEKITVIPDPLATTTAAANMARPGDLLVITAAGQTCERVLPLIEAALAEHPTPAS